MLTVLLSLMNIVCVVWVVVACPEQCTCHRSELEYLPSVYVVFCGWKRLTAVPDLRTLTSVKLSILLDLQGNRIASVEKDDFPRGLRVIMLKLAKNRGVDLAESAFANLADSLEILDVSETDVQFDERLAFAKGLVKLTSLDLGSNVQRTGSAVKRDFLDVGLLSLKRLAMSKCRIADVEDGAFHGVRTLKELDLSVNRLLRVPAAVNYLTKLVDLKLNSNKIRNLFRHTFLGLRSLATLTLDQNAPLSVHSGAFHGLEDTLRNLLLRGCGLRDLPASVRRLTSVVELDLSHNSLSRLSSMHGAFCLRQTDVSYSHIRLRTDEVFVKQSSCLKIIIIDHCSLTEVPVRALRPLKTAVYVSLKNNKIKVVPKNAFAGMHATVIGLQGNPITRIERGAFNELPSGVKLALDDSTLTDLDFILDYRNDKFRHISVSNTVIKCTCQMYVILRFIKPSIVEGTCSIKNKRHVIGLPETMALLKDLCAGNNSPSQPKSGAITVNADAATVVGTAAADTVDAAVVIDIVAEHSDDDDFTTSQANITSDISESTTTVDSSQSTSTVGSSQTITTVDGSLSTTTVDSSQTITTVGSSQAITTVDGSLSTTTVDSSQTITTVGSSQAITTVDGSLSTTTVDSSQTITSADGSQANTTVDISQTITTADISQANTTVDISQANTTVDISQANTTGAFSDYATDNYNSITIPRRSFTTSKQPFKTKGGNRSTRDLILGISIIFLVLGSFAITAICGHVNRVKVDRQEMQGQVNVAYNAVSESHIETVFSN